MTRDKLMTAVRAWLDERKAALTHLPDEVAVGTAILFPAWRAGEVYMADERIRYGEKLYRVVQAHTSQAEWEPDKTPALFTEVPKPGEIPEWKQPTGAQDAYAKGDKVRHNGNVWESQVDANVWEPGVYGWQQIMR